MQRRLTKLTAAGLALCLLAWLLGTAPMPLAAYSYDAGSHQSDNLLVNPIPTGSLAGWQVTNGYWNDGDFGGEIKGNTSSTVSASQTVALSDADILRAAAGELTVSADGFFWGQACSTITASLTVEFLDKNGTLLSSKADSCHRYDAGGANNETLSFSGHTVPAGTTQMKLKAVNDNSLTRGPSMRNFHLRLTDAQKPSYHTTSLSAINGNAIPVGGSVAGTYPAGTNLRYAVKLSEPVVVTGSGTLSVSLGGTTSAATYAGQSPDKTMLYYDYAIPSSGVISDNTYVKMSTIAGLAVRDDAGNATTIDKTLSDGYGIYMDNKPPTVSQFTTTASANSSYRSGDQIAFNVSFHEEINVSGSPYISLANGQRAIYTAGSGSQTKLATFVYTVGNADANTDALAITGVNFTGIVDKVNQPASYDAHAYDSYLGSYQLKIDTTAPTVSMSAPGSGWLGQSYAVTLAPSDAVGALQGSGVDELYAVWTTDPSASAPAFPTNPNVGSGNTFAAPTKSGSYYLWVKATDLAGNAAATKSPATYRFDLTAPQVTITANTVSGYPGLASVSVDVSDSGSGVATKNYAWQLDGATVSSGDLSASEIVYPAADGSYTLVVTAADQLGNTAVVSEANLAIDCTAPTVTFTPAGMSEHRQAHTVSIELSDAKTGVESFAYQWTTSPTAPVSGWIPTTETTMTTPSAASGSYYLHIRSTDRAGNTGETVSGAFNLDNTPPVISLYPNGDAAVDSSAYEIGITVEDAVTATADLSVQYAFGTGEAATDLSWQPLTGSSLTLSRPNATTYLYVKATDALGNVAELKSAPFIPMVDSSAPTGSISNNSGAFVNTPSVRLSFTAADNYAVDSDLMMQLIVDDLAGDWSVFVASRTVDFASTEGVHSVSVKYRDLSGNESETYSTSFTYDVTPPAIEIAYSSTVASNGTVTATASTAAPDMIDGASSYVFNENGSYAFQARDAAGNSSERVATVTWIDKIAPTIGFVSAQLDNKPHQAVSVTINATDNANGVASLAYRFVPAAGTAGEWLSCDNSASVTLNNTDGTYYLEVQATDGAGNSCTSRSSSLYLDNTPPSASLQYEPASRTAQNVQAAISFNEPATVTNNGGNNTYVFADNGSFAFTFADAAGNAATATASVDWIDRSTPKATIIIKDRDNNSIARDQWVNHDLLVTIAPPAQSVIEQLTFNGQAIDKASGVSVHDADTSTYLVTSYGIFEFTVRDTETALESTGALTVRIDCSAPIFKSERRTPEGWTNGDVIVTITAEDDRSPVNYIGGNEHTFSANGSYRFRFTDVAGNQGEYVATVGNIDKAAPSASVAYTANGKPYDGGYTNANVTATISLDSLSPVTVTNNEGSLAHTFTSNGEFTFHFTDAAGNTGSQTVSVDKIERTPPVAYVTYSNERWTNADVVATLHVSDSQSGAANDGATQTFSANGSHIFTASDLAGNATEVTATVTRIDKTPPKLSYTLSPAKRTPYSVFATVAADENVTWLNNGGRPSLQFTANGSFTFRAQDRAGNNAEIEVVVENISKASTPVKLIYSETKPTSGSVHATLVPVDATDVIFVLNNGGSATHTFSENGEFSFSYRNPAGIEGTAIASVSNIDKLAPVIDVTYSVSELTSGSVTASLTASEPVIWPFGVKDGVYTFTANGKVQIPVADAVGNVTNVLLQVTCIDNTPPKITLTQEYQAIAIGSKFDALAGVTVYDEHAATEGLSYQGSVNTNLPGDYTITYLAVDAVGNTVTASKSVTVYDPQQFNLVVNGRMPVNGEVEIVGGQMRLATVNQQGQLKLLCLSGKKGSGDFKLKGSVIAPEHTFTAGGYYTLYIQDDERHTKIIHLFVKL